MRCFLYALLLFFTLIICPPIKAESVRFVSSPVLSPDGTNIYFSWRGDIWRTAVDGGRVERITSDSAQETSPVISPDGTLLYYSSNRTGANQVYRMQIAGGRPTQLTFHSEGSVAIDISADGATLFTMGQRDAWWRWSNRFFEISSTQPRAGEKQLFNAYGSDAVVSKDGTRILFSREGMSWSRKQYNGSRAGQIWLWSADSNTYEQILGDSDYDVRYPVWAPDEQSFYFVSELDGTKNLWQYIFKSKKIKQLTTFADDGVVSPAISSDGSVMIFRRLFDLYRFELGKNKPPQKLTLEYQGDLFIGDEVEKKLRKATSASFSKSGKTVAFVAGGDVWVMNDTLKEPVQITSTPFYESELIFDEDRERLLFVSARDGQVDIYQAKRLDPNLPWWRNHHFEFKQLTNDATVESDLRLSPKSNRLSFVKHREGLWVWDLKAEQDGPREIVKTWSSLSYAWSPNETWLAYSASDNNFNYDIHLVDVDSPDRVINVSRHPDNEFNPVWSPDGNTLAFVGRRFDDEYDIYYVSLSQEKHERTVRDDKLEQALKIKESKAGSITDSVVNKNATSDPATQLDIKNTFSLEDLRTITRRIRKISIPGATETQLVWSPDSKLLAFQAEIDGKQGIYTITPYVTTTTSFLISGKADILEWRRSDNRFYWLKDGVPGWTSTNGSNKAELNFTAVQYSSLSSYHREIFEECWRIMRDDFYDGNFNNLNWDQIRRKYIEVAGATVTKANLSRTVAMMLGELNASHLGYRGLSDESPTLSKRHQTGHLGAYFDQNYKGPGLKVHESVVGGPAAALKSRLLPGDVILTINETAVDPSSDITRVLNGTVGRETYLGVQRNDSEVEVVIIPIDYSAFRSLLYERWVSANQDRVARKSDGKLGYLHIRAMNMTSFHRFERELFEVADGKEGIVIDVRENGGGFTTDHLLTILTQPRHAITRPRGGGEGYPQDRSIYATWDKPIVVLCNQNSHSNAEIFSHAIRHLGRGKVIGVPTSGSVISTGSRAVMDAGTIRIPFRGWYLLSDGQDMELNGAIPHHIVWPLPGQIVSGVDIQLSKAISVLRREVIRVAKQPVPKPIKASERENINVP